MLPNEAQLISRVQSGQTEDFALIYDHYVRQIYRFVYFKTHHTQTAEDLTSDIFMKALEKISSYNTNRGPFMAWLYQIARNTIIDEYRKRRPTLNIEDAWDLSSTSSPNRNLEETMLLDRLKNCLEGLSADQRDIIILRIWQGLNYKEIAEALGKTEANCKTIYSRALKKMKSIVPELLTILILSQTIIYLSR